MADGVDDDIELELRRIELQQAYAKEKFELEEKKLSLLAMKNKRMAPVSQVENHGVVKLEGERLGTQNTDEVVDLTTPSPSPPPLRAKQNVLKTEAQTTSVPPLQGHTIAQTAQEMAEPSSFEGFHQNRRRDVTTDLKQGKALGLTFTPPARMLRGPDYVRSQSLVPVVRPEITGVYYCKGISATQWDRMTLDRRARVSNVHHKENDQYGMAAEIPCDYCQECGYVCRTFKPEVENFGGRHKREACARCRHQGRSCSLIRA